MKKIALLLVFSMISTATLLAQNSAVNKASSFLDNQKLDLAKQNIDEATVHDKTKDKGKTWYIKGKVYNAIANSDNPEFQGLATDPLSEAVEAFKKAISLEKEASTYHIFSKEEVKQIWNATLNKGADYYEQGDFDLAIEQFDQLKKINPQDTTGYLYAGISAMQISQFDVVEENYYKLLDMGHKSPDIYSGLIWIEKNQNNNEEKALALVKEARELMPENLDIMKEEINLLLGMENKEEALKKTEQAALAEPDNHSLYYILGYLYDEIGNNQKAEESYLKSIELKPDNFDANYNLAVLHFNRGVEFIKKANDLSLDEYQKKGKAIKDQSKSHLEAALPYLLKAHEIKPDDAQTVEIIQTIYAELGQTAKSNEYKQKLDAMGGNN